MVHDEPVALGRSRTAMQLGMTLQPLREIVSEGKSTRQINIGALLNIE
jgi:hypothetical protein